MADCPVLLLQADIDGQPGLDVRITHESATVSDLLLAFQAAGDDPLILKPMLRQRYGVCAGCRYNCCRSHDIPLDLLAARGIADRLEMSLPRFARHYLNLTDAVTFPELRVRPCPFLDNDLCTVYEDRALICRLYLCTPMSERLESLRGAVLLTGNAALRQALVEAGIAPRRWQQPALARQLAVSRAGREEFDRLRYLTEDNPYLHGFSHRQVLLRDCVSPRLWRDLL